MPTVSEIFEKYVFCQMPNYMVNFLSKCQNDFRKECNAWLTYSF